MLILTLSIHLNKAPWTSSPTTGMPALEKRMGKEGNVFQRIKMFSNISVLKFYLKLILNFTLYGKIKNSIQW